MGNNCCSADAQNLSNMTTELEFNQNIQKICCFWGFFSSVDGALGKIEQKRRRRMSHVKCAEDKPEKYES